MVTESGEDKQCKLGHGTKVDRGFFALTTLDDTFTSPTVAQQRPTKPKKCVKSLFDYPEAKVVESSTEDEYSISESDEDDSLDFEAF